MKKILMSLLSISLVASVAVSATRAYFSDTETSTGNTFATGSLDLELKLGEENSLPFNISNAQPGDSGEEKVTLRNSGTLAGNLNINFENFVQSENGLNEPELKAGDYDNGGDLWLSFDIVGYIDVDRNKSFNDEDIQITYNSQHRSYPGFWGGDFHWHGITSNLNGWQNVLTLVPGQEVDVVLRWRVDPNWDYSNYNQNIIQTDSLGFDLVFGLEQVR